MDRAQVQIEEMKLIAISSFSEPPSRYKCVAVLKEEFPQASYRECVDVWSEVFQLINELNKEA